MEIHAGVAQTIVLRVKDVNFKHMINYELAKQLKDAGFQKTIDQDWFEKTIKQQWEETHAINI